MFYIHEWCVNNMLKCYLIVKKTLIDKSCTETILTLPIPSVHSM